LIRLIRQIYSGKILEVVREDALWLHIINPDFPSQPFLISREHYETKWEPYKEPKPFLNPSPARIEQETAPPKKRGRPLGSKNKVKP